MGRKSRGGLNSHWQFHGPVKSRWVPVPERFCPLELRKLVYERDGGQCQYCGGEVAFDRFHVDHVLPWSKGGRTVLTNLVVSCRACNMTKFADRIPESLAPPTAWEREHRPKPRKMEPLSPAAFARVTELREMRKRQKKA